MTGWRSTSAADPAPTCSIWRGAGWTIFKDVQYVIRLMDELDTPLGSFEGVIGAALRRTEAHQRHH